MNILETIDSIAAKNGSEIALAALVAKHAALGELKSLAAVLSADNIKMNWKEVGKRYNLGDAAYEQACRNPDKFGLISAETLSVVIDEFEDGLEPLPDNYAPPVPPVTEAAGSVEEIKARIAAIPVRDLTTMTVRRPQAQSSVTLELATGLHEVATSQSSLCESHALLTADLHSVQDNTPVVTAKGTIVAINSGNKLQIIAAVYKGRAQFSDSPERIAAQAAARERLEADLVVAEAALVAAEALAEIERQEIERIRLSTPIAFRFLGGQIVTINDATREMLTAMAANGFGALLLPEA